MTGVIILSILAAVMYEAIILLEKLVTRKVSRANKKNSVNRKSN